MMFRILRSSFDWLILPQACLKGGHAEPEIVFSEPKIFWRCSRCEMKLELPDDIKMDELRFVISDCYSSLVQEIKDMKESGDILPRAERTLLASYEKVFIRNVERALATTYRKLVKSVAKNTESYELSELDTLMIAAKAAIDVYSALVAAIQVRRHTPRIPHLEERPA